MQNAKWHREATPVSASGTSPGITDAPSSFCILYFAFCILHSVLRLSHCFRLPLLLLLCWFLFFHRLAERDLWSSHEARAAQNAQGMLDSGDWLLPRLYDQRPDLQKPPLYYWLVAGVARLRGGRVDAWAVRLPAALAGLGTVLAIAWLAGAFRGRRAGWLAAAVLASALHFTWLARVGRIDMPLTLAVTLAMAGYFKGLSRLREYPQLKGRGENGDLRPANWASGTALLSRPDGSGEPSYITNLLAPGIRAWPWFLLAYLAVAAAVLLKGPIGLVLPAAIVFTHLLVSGELTRNRPAGVSLGRHWRRLAHWLGLWWGLPLVLTLTLPWFWCVNVRTEGEFFRVFFWYHNVERGFGGSGKLATHPWWFYLPRFACDFLPWSPVLLVAAWSFGKRRDWRQDREAVFGLVWLAATVVLLSGMRFKRADYLLPAYPGAALFLGCLGQRWLKEKGKWGWCPASLVAFCLLPFAFCLVIAGWWVYLHRTLPEQERRYGYREFAAAIRRRVPAPQPVILFRTKPHALTFHLGRPVDTLLEWENLDIWAGRAGTFYVVMPPALVRQWPRHVTSGRLVEVLRSTDLAGASRERTLVLLRTRPNAGPAPR
jgi:4-amino-4-deoxy-L-arabinose transferase-like glycosyltransferase